MAISPRRRAHAAASQFGPEDLDADYIAKARVPHVSAIFEAMGSTDIAFPGDEKAALLTGLKEADEVVDQLLALGVGIAALKCGAQGAVMATKDRREWAACPRKRCPSGISNFQIIRFRK